MFAIIEDGSRQYRVEVGRRVSLDYRSEAKDGDTLTLEKVMLANGGAASVVGKPLIEGAKVTAEVVVAEEKGEKLEIQKIRRRKNSRRHTGHRQKYTLVNVTAIDVPGLEVSEDDGKNAFAADAEQAAE
ncbi:MAG: 50S ribosomal protein L21 [Planctomycetota bacterium]